MLMLRCILSATLQTLPGRSIARPEYRRIGHFHAPSDHSKSLGAIPLGPLVIPSLRWILRRHHLVDDEPTRYLLREYILSACNVAEKFAALLETSIPRPWWFSMDVLPGSRSQVVG